ncbi:MULTISPECIES: response regulator transcription factor [Microbacterium]|uniref:response regulator n=1 Tax=Microbacterium TaxID=33882 RepID=UPI001E57024E|nr:response regulator transcription factor [Microbacterium nymphoidis]MCD2500000.1 response regulator transcription factor [Microbacterium nymphoidis]
MIRILLVDDHPVLRHGMRALLGTQPDLAVVAETGSAAEAITLAASADVALIDLDLGADVPGGIDAAAAIRRSGAPTRVLIFTAYDSDADIVRALDAGAVGYLVKDSRPDELFRAIRSAVSADPGVASSLTASMIERAAVTDETLTARELEVLSLAAAGLSTRELAARLFVSEATVKTHLHHAFTKLGAENRQAAIAIAVKRGLVRI